MYFEAKLSGAVKVATISLPLLALLLFVVTVGLYFPPKEFLVGGVKVTVIGFIYSIICIAGIGFLALRERVSGYTLASDKLEIYRLWQEGEIILLKRLEAEGVAINPFKKAIMVSASGRFCGFYKDFKQMDGPYLPLMLRILSDV